MLLSNNLSSKEVFYFKHNNNKHYIFVSTTKLQDTNTQIIIFLYWNRKSWLGERLVLDLFLLYVTPLFIVFQCENRTWTRFSVRSAGRPSSEAAPCPPTCSSTATPAPTHAHTAASGSTRSQTWRSIRIFIQVLYNVYGPSLYFEHIMYCKHT